MPFLPSILVASAHSFDAEEIIKLITKKECADKTEIENGISSYDWKISNKYYSANVILCSMNTKAPLKKEFGEATEAVIIYFDINKEDCIAELDEWLNCVKDYNISEQVLICKSSIGLNEAKKDLVNDWCVKNKFELVELEQERENTESDSFVEELIGIERVVEILHAHEWPNLVLKGKTSNSGGFLDIENNFEELNALSSALNELSTEGNSNLKHENESDTQLGDEELDCMEKLSLLFQNLQSIKKEISSLETNHKLDHAEKTVKAFWNAIGGDADEFSDSEDDSNNCT